jgi:hypothetical protein
MEPGSVAGVLVWENLWTAPSHRLAAPGQLIADGRIPMQAIIAAIEADTSPKEIETETSTSRARRSDRPSVAKTAVKPHRAGPPSSRGGDSDRRHGSDNRFFHPLQGQPTPSPIGELKGIRDARVRLSSRGHLHVDVLFFIFFIWIMLLFRVFDPFRSHDIGGFANVVVPVRPHLPFLGNFVYVIVRGRSMSGRNVSRRAGTARRSAPMLETPAPVAAPPAARQLADLKDDNDHSGRVRRPEAKRWLTSVPSAGRDVAWSITVPVPEDLFDEVQRSSMRGRGSRDAYLDRRNQLRAVGLYVRHTAGRGSSTIDDPPRSRVTIATSGEER